jgi:hypothetical protein
VGPVLAGFPCVFYDFPRASAALFFLFSFPSFPSTDLSSHPRGSIRISTLQTMPGMMLSPIALPTRKSPEEQMTAQDGTKVRPLARLVFVREASFLYLPSSAGPDRCPNPSQYYLVQICVHDSRCVQAMEVPCSPVPGTPFSTTCSSPTTDASIPRRLAARRRKGTPSRGPDSAFDARFQGAPRVQGSQACWLWCW